MCGGSPSAPIPPAAIPETPRAPDVGSSELSGDEDRKRRARATGAGSRSTILTGSRGVQDGAATTTKTLLGQ